MRLTPRDIQEKEFSSGFRGYKEEEVDGFLDEVTEAYEAVFKENLDLREEVEKLREECKKYETIGERMQSALVAAQETADDVRRNAAKEAENVLREAELKSQKMIQETKDKHLDLQKQLASLKQVEDEFRFKMKSMLQSYLKLVEEMPFGESKEVKALLVPPDYGMLGQTAPLPMEEKPKEPKKEEPKLDLKEEAKVTPKPEVKETVEPKVEVKEEEKPEAKEEAKPEVKEEAKAEAKAATTGPFDFEEEKPATEGRPAGRKLAPKETKAGQPATTGKPAEGGKPAEAGKSKEAEKEKAAAEVTEPGKEKKTEKKEGEPGKSEEKKTEEGKEKQIDIIEDETFWKDA